MGLHSVMREDARHEHIIQTIRRKVRLFWNGLRAPLIVPLAIKPIISRHIVARDVLRRVVENIASCVEGSEESPRIACRKTRVREQLTRSADGPGGKERPAVREIIRGVRLSVEGGGEVGAIWGENELAVRGFPGSRSRNCPSP